MSGLVKIVLVVLALGLAEAGHSSYGGSSYRKRPAAAPRAASKSIAELVIADEKNFSTLLAAVKAAGLAETLAGPGTFTVFAPTNAAFAKVPADALKGLLADPAALKNVLLRHVLGSVVKAEDIPKGSTEVDTLSGEKITVTKNYNGVSIKSSAGSAKVIIPNVMATNGVVHAVDSVF